MYPWLVDASQLTFIGPAMCTLADQVFPPLTEEVKPISSWQVLSEQLVLGK
jgi:hypothetical protein